LVMMRFFRKISPHLDMSKADNSHWNAKDQSLDLKITNTYKNNYPILLYRYEDPSILGVIKLYEECSF
jgi:hypothetical protein